MPDTLTPEELAAIREREAGHLGAYTPIQAQADRRALLAHIDTLTAAGRRYFFALDAPVPYPGDDFYETGPTLQETEHALRALIEEPHDA